MTLRFLGLYEAEETGDIVVQGDRLTDLEHLAQLRDVGEHETFVVIPRELLTHFAPKE
jgi:sorbitol-specific phosphotransferase system component IIA